MYPESRPLAAIRYDRGFDVDDLMLRSCALLRSHGLRIGGLIQRSAGERGACAASVHVVDLRSGEAFDIWEKRGACARGCRLNEGGLIDVEPSIMTALAAGLDLLVINRFGRAESLGRGLVGCFMTAIEAGVPVLTAVRAPYEDAWRNFHGGLGRDLQPDLSAVITWSIGAKQGAPLGFAAGGDPISLTPIERVHWRCVLFLVFFKNPWNIACMRERIAVLSLAALAHQHRLRIFRLLVKEGPSGLPAGEIADRVGISATNTSFHLKELDRARLLRATRQGRYIRYVVDVDGMRKLLTYLTEDCCQGRPELCGETFAASSKLCRVTKGA